MEIQLKSVQLKNGEKLGYRERAGGEQVLLLIHGNMTSSKHWDLLMERIDPRYRVVAVDLRGFGISTYHQPIHSLQDFAKDVKQFVDELGLEGFTMVGWSTGGGVAMQFAADYPGYAEKLILLASASTRGYPFYRVDERGQPVERLQTRAEIAADPVRTQPIQAAYRQRNKAFLRNLWDTLIYTDRQPDPERYEAYLEDMMTQRNLADVYHALNTFNISDQHNGLVQGTGAVHQIQIPVLVIQGRKDRVVIESMAREILEDLGERARLVMLDHCGHSPLVDDLDQLLRVMSDFLQE